ncbi:type IV toxin-antitoxin system AbiEi family antitoxin domain-containing protein [Parafrigoribacterium soli]|uniref:type IV toxin-antitoxin system AbiEi family antitoxin domain-containing protein n=1 Tax=Parafrigoribacterium soli TaxID=3144663 RepID=UPI0032EE69E0
MEPIASANGIVLTKELVRLGVDDAAYRKAAARGDVERLHRGAYMDAGEWKKLEAHERYRQRVIAALLASRGNPVASHASAAALWRLPIIGQWPELVHVLASRSTGTRTENGFRRHAVDREDVDVVELDGIRVTSIERTLIDVAAAATFASAVATVDHALRRKLATTSALRRYFEAVPHARFQKRVIRVLDFATPLAGSPGESLSRVNIHELGFPAPELQVVFTDRAGRVGDVDFWWRSANLIGEFDGLVKYTRAEYLQGRSIEDVVIAEKIREDRLRALGPNVSRWLWGVALRPRELYAHLSSAGLRPVRTSSHF